MHISFISQGTYLISDISYGNIILKNFKTQPNPKQNLDEAQKGVRSESETTAAIFIIKQLAETVLEIDNRKKNSWNITAWRNVGTNTIIGIRTVYAFQQLARPGIKQYQNKRNGILWRFYCTKSLIINHFQISVFQMIQFCQQTSRQI